MNSVEPEGFSLHEAPEAASHPKRRSTSKLTEWQRFFLERLDSLLARQRENSAPDEASNTLLSKAVYSTYLDCQTQGVGDEALQHIAGNSGAPSAN